MIEMTGGELSFAGEDVADDELAVEVGELEPLDWEASTLAS